MTAAAKTIRSPAIHEPQRHSALDRDAVLGSKIGLPRSLQAAQAMEWLERAGYTVACGRHGYLVLDRHQVWEFGSDIGFLAFTEGVAAQRQRCSRRHVPYTKVTYEL